MYEPPLPEHAEELLEDIREIVRHWHRAKNTTLDGTDHVLSRLRGLAWSLVSRLDRAGEGEPGIVDALYELNENHDFAELLAEDPAAAELTAGLEAGAKARLRCPRFEGAIEFDSRVNGLGSEEARASMTKFEARLCLRHWLAMCWAVETNFDGGTSGSWECAMLNYANYRIRKLKESGLITDADIDEISSQWDWPPFPDSEDEMTCDPLEFPDLEEVESYPIAQTSSDVGAEEPNMSVPEQAGE